MERPSKPYGSRSGYARKHVRGVTPSPFFDGEWHDFEVTVHSHDHYSMSWDGVVMADVQENTPPTMAGRNRVGLRCDFLDIEIRDFAVTTDEEPAAMSTVHPREDWQDPARPVAGPAAKSVGGAWVIHYPGGGSFEPLTDDQVAKYLRGIQASYLDGRGYSIGYSFGVAQSGSTWELRGHDINPASNPGRKLAAGNFNDRSRSIFAMVGNDNEATPEAVAAINALIGRSSHTATSTLRRAAGPVLSARSATASSATRHHRNRHLWKRTSTCLHSSRSPGRRGSRTSSP